MLNNWLKQIHKQRQLQSKADGFGWVMGEHCVKGTNVKPILLAVQDDQRRSGRNSAFNDGAMLAINYLTTLKSRGKQHER